MAENKVDPKEIEKVQKLLSDEEFVKKLISQETIEDAKKLFEDQGITTSIEEMEMLGKLLNKISENNVQLSDDYLENVTGGSNVEKNLTISSALADGTVGYGAGLAIGGALGAVVGGITLAVASNYRDNKLSQEILEGGFEAAVPGGAVLGAGIAGILGCVIGGIVGGIKEGHKWFDKKGR